MSTCCLRRVNGAPVSGGGAAAAAGWQHVYTLDFRDVFTAQGAVDLNFVGSTLVFDGITWSTPTIANTGVDMNVLSTAFGIDATGLMVRGQGGGSIVATAPSFTHIFANLAALAANSATPFDGDPTRMYLLQAYVSVTTASGNGDESGVGLYKITDIPDTPSGEATTFNTFGFNTATLDVPSCTAGVGGSPGRLDRLDLLGAGGIDYDCPTIQYANSGKLVNVWAGSFSDTGDWPAESALQSIGNFAAVAEFGNDTTGDPDDGFRFVVGMAGTGFDSSIQQLRLCQL